MSAAAFHEVVFPLSVAFGASGGPERRTDIITLGSGFEERNARWASARRRYDAGDGIRTRDDLDRVIQFFEERRGRLYGFRYRDPIDHTSCAPSGVVSALDQVLGEGDGVRTDFPLVKRYGTTFAPFDRPIAKPVAGSVLVAVAGTPLSEGTDFDVAATTGLVTFRPHAVPSVGEAVTAGFRFDTPVRFDTDRLEINLSSFEAGVIPSIPIVEIRL